MNLLSQTQLKTSKNHKRYPRRWIGTRQSAMESRFYEENSGVVFHSTHCSWYLLWCVGFTPSIHCQNVKIPTTICTVNTDIYRESVEDTAFSSWPTSPTNASWFLQGHPTLSCGGRIEFMRSSHAGFDDLTITTVVGVKTKTTSTQSLLKTQHSRPGHQVPRTRLDS